MPNNEVITISPNSRVYNHGQEVDNEVYNHGQEVVRNDIIQHLKDEVSQVVRQEIRNLNYANVHKQG